MPTQFLQLGFEWKRKSEKDAADGDDDDDTDSSNKIDMLKMAKEAAEKNAGKGRANAKRDDEAWNSRL